MNLDSFSTLNFDDMLPNFSDAADEIRNRFWQKFQEVRLLRVSVLREIIRFLGGEL